MKTILSACISGLFVTVLMLVSACSDPGPSSAEGDRVKTLLKSTTWQIQSVTIDGTDATSKFAGFTLKFSDATYTATTGRVVWPSSGTWRFVNDQAKSFKRDDEIVVDIVNLTDTSLTLSLIWTKTTIGNGRTESMRGRHIFIFKK